MADLIKDTSADMAEDNERKWSLLTFIKFTDKKTSLTLLCDCVEDAALDTTIRKHESNSFREISGSRSGGRSLQEAETITVTFGGELQAGKAIPNSKMKVAKGFTINPVTVGIKVNKNANYCIIHYDGNKACKAQTVLFSVNEEYKLMTKFKTRKFSDSDSQQATGGDNSDGKVLSESELAKTRQVSEVDYEERQPFLQELTLKRYQFLVSSVYRCVAETEVEVSVRASLLNKATAAAVTYTFSYFVHREHKWFIVPASYSEKASQVEGKVSPRDVFCAVAEFSAERKTLGKNGGSFISEKDNRVQVNIPEGALDQPTDFTFRLEAVDLDRYRTYGEHLPDIFSCLVGFPTSLSIEHEMRGPLKQKAKVYLPVIGDGDEKEVLFLHWEDDKAIPLNHKQDATCPEAPYFVEVNHFSTVSAQVKKSKTTVNETINATKLLLGQASVCTILTYIVPNYIRGMPGLLVDCVELPRVKTVTKDYADEGYKELPGSRSKDCVLEECGYVKVDVGGNIQLEPGIRIKDMRLRFFKNNSTNRIMVPVKFRNPSQTLSKVTYTTFRKDWEHQVYFSVADYIEKTALVRQRSATDPEPMPKVPRVLSEKSLSALGEAVPETTWFKIGIELEMTDDSLKKYEGSPNVGFRVLKEWLQKNARDTSDKLISDLVAAFEEIERVDISEVVKNANEKDQPIRRKDFGGGGPKREEPPSASGHTHGQIQHGAQSAANANQAKNVKPFRN